MGQSIKALQWIESVVKTDPSDKLTFQSMEAIEGIAKSEFIQKQNV